MDPATKLMTKAAWHARSAPEVVEKSNRKLERWHYSVNGEAIRPPLSHVAGANPPPGRRVYAARKLRAPT